MSIRMIPMSIVFSRFPRMLRDLAGKLGKKVDFVTQGEATELDKGLVEKITDPKAKPGEKCVECTDERKDQPILGLEILRGLKKVDGKDVWDGGTVVEPATGKIYRAKVSPIEGGTKLEMRGYIGPFYRTQVWLRVE